MTSDHYEVFFDLILPLEFAVRVESPGPNSRLYAPLYSHSFDALIPSDWFPYIHAVRTSVTENTCHLMAVHSFDMTSLRMRKLNGHKENTTAVLLAVCVAGVA
jgi:hypothetical protein